MLKNDYGKSSPNGHSNPHKPAELPTVASDTAVVTVSAQEPMRFVAPTHGGIDILKLLTDLEHIVDRSPKVMGAMLRFDEDKFHMTVMKIRANLPEEMKRASKLVRDSERIVEETKETSDKIITDTRYSAQQELERAKSEAARLKEQALAEIVKEREALDREAKQMSKESKLAADQTIAEARQQASKLVADSEIIRAAEAIARDIRSRSEADAAAIRKGANDYAAGVLNNLQQALGKAATEVERGREVLDKRT